MEGCSLYLLGYFLRVSFKMIMLWNTENSKKFQVTLARCNQAKGHLWSIEREKEIWDRLTGAVNLDRGTNDPPSAESLGGPVDLWWVSYLTGRKFQQLVAPEEGHQDRNHGEWQAKACKKFWGWSYLHSDSGIVLGKIALWSGWFRCLWG